MVHTQYAFVNWFLKKTTDKTPDGEIYIIQIDNFSWYQNNLGKSAICVLNPEKTIYKLQADNEVFVVMHKSGMRIYSCYYSPYIELVQFQSRSSRKDKEISKVTDQREISVSEMFASLDMMVLKKYSTRTFRREDYNSIIDITAAVVHREKRKVQWGVLDDETLSGYQHVVINIDSLNRKCSRASQSRWNTHKIDVE